MIRNGTTPVYPSFLISLGLNNLTLPDLFVRLLFCAVTKSYDNNELTLLKRTN